MQISVTPNSTASRIFSAKDSSSTWYASGERFPWPKPQNAQPTWQTLVKLMLRLTTNVAVSPARRARSSSAARRMSSITSGRRSANSAVSSSRVSAAPSRARLDRAGRKVCPDRHVLATAATRGAG